VHRKNINEQQYNSEYTYRQ